MLLMKMGKNRVSGAKCGHAVFRYLNIRLSCLLCSRDKNLIYINEMNIHDRREDHVPTCTTKLGLTHALCNIICSFLSKPLFHFHPYLQSVLIDTKFKVSILCVSISSCIVTAGYFSICQDLLREGYPHCIYPGINQI